MVSPHPFIFVREDGRAFGVADVPTPEDLDHAKFGLVTIVRTADLHWFGRSGKWEPLAAGELAAPIIEDSPSAPFHVPAGF